MLLTAVYPGSFDPLTLGHLDIVTRASHLFQSIIIAVAQNDGKSPFFTLEERLALVSENVKHLKNVRVESFEGLTVNFVQAHQAQVIIRGLRAVSDFEYEFKMSQMNKTLSPDIETVFMMADLDYQFLSSSVVKEVALLGGNIDSLVPPSVCDYLKSKITEKAAS